MRLHCHTRIDGPEWCQCAPQKLPELTEAAGLASPVSPATRELCAARLLSTLDAVSRVSRPRPVSSAPSK